MRVESDHSVGIDAAQVRRHQDPCRYVGVRRRDIQLLEAPAYETRELLVVDARQIRCIRRYHLFLPIELMRTLIDEPARLSTALD
jgi:hypothetical protein